MDGEERERTAFSFFFLSLSLFFTVKEKFQGKKKLANKNRIRESKRVLCVVMVVYAACLLLEEKKRLVGVWEEATVNGV